jgi:hypothetical protein
MFRVKWVVRFDEDRPVHVEDSVALDLDNVVAAGKEKLHGMRMSRSDRPPDGFIVLDDDGNEVRRWMSQPND